MYFLGKFFVNTWALSILYANPAPCLTLTKAEEKKRQEEEEILSKKLHEEQALHEAQLKEVCLAELSHAQRAQRSTVGEKMW